MKLRTWQCTIGLSMLLLASADVTEVRAQSLDELKQRLQELERSTRQQIESLKRMIEQREADPERQRRAEEERERAYRALKEQVERQQLSLEKQEERVARISAGSGTFFDPEAGRKQRNNGPAPLGKDIQGNVYTSDDMKIRLGGSLRLHVQRNDTPVGESVGSALLPDTSVPGGGNNARRENFRAFAGRTRFNLAIRGPETFGGKTSGFFEMDFEREFTAGESGAVTPNPRLRHAFGRWSFDDVWTQGDEAVLTLGQTGSFADATAETVDFNTLLGGLGASERRNPRFELLYRYPVASNLKVVAAFGVERPFFGSDFIATDLGPGDLSGFPALSGGIGLEVGRLGQGFGIGSTKIYARTTWGEFEERFDKGTTTAHFSAQTNFDERTFTNQAVHGGFVLDGIGFNQNGRALTLKLLGGGLWTRGDAQHLNASFDRRVIIDSDGTLVPAQSLGGFINPIFYLTDTFSIRWAGGAQWALDDNQQVVTGQLTSNFFRANNRQSELSLWWTPGPFTFGLSYNHTETHWRRVFSTGRSESRDNENNKIEFISWFSF